MTTLPARAVWAARGGRRPAPSRRPPRGKGGPSPRGPGACKTDSSSQLPSICLGGCPGPGTGTWASCWARLKPRAGAARLPFVQGAGHWGKRCFLWPFPATLDWIWVQRQMHGLWLGWEETCPQPGLPTHQQTRPGATTETTRLCARTRPPRPPTCVFPSVRCLSPLLLRSPFS